MIGADWDSALEPRADRPRARPEFALSESPRYIGRGITAIAADPDRSRWDCGCVTSGQLARAYSFTDVDGSRPDLWRYTLDCEAGSAGDLSGYR